jgi:hypothetical protein
MPGSGRPDVTGRSARLWLFLVVVFGWTWSFWIFAAAFEIGVRTTTGQTLLRVGLFGPMLGGIAFAFLCRDTILARILGSSDRSVGEFLI